MAVGRTVRNLAVGTTLLAGLASLAVVYVLRRPVPRSSGTVRLRGLRDDVEVVRDRWGVPHIYADNLHDLFFAVGYAQAQDRLWQMDFTRRLASGRLSEVVGQPAIEIDRLMRRVGFHRTSETDVETATERERAVLDAFSAGINAYMDRAKAPLEFSILRYRPEAWRPQDTLAIGRLIGWSLSGNWDSEIMRSWTISRFGAELSAELNPGYPRGHKVIVPPGTESVGPGPDLRPDFEGVIELAGAGTGGMSNNWAVNGDRSATGKPLLASDPHLPLGIPAIWWEMHIDSPELKAAGVGMPGMPGVFMGHNERIAWGMTAAMADGDDLFVEQINPDDPSQYRHKDAWEQGEVIREEIPVRKGEPIVENVLVTRHGPVVSPAIEGEERTLALRSVTLDPCSQIDTQLMLMGARNWNEFREALSEWPMPSLNFAYADVDGNIGYQLAGKVPIRGKGHGVVPAPGWTGDHEWTGYVPFDELPNAYNPPTGWVASANNKIVDDDYPHFLAANWADGYRQQRIVDMIEERDKHTVEDFQEMQVDQLSLSATELVPLILQLNARDEASERALNHLRAWDYRVAADSVAACVYEVYYTELVRRAIEEKVGDWSEYFMGRGVHPMRRNGMFFNAAHGWLLEKMRERPAWFEGKTWHEVMEDCLATATADLSIRLGPEVSTWRWGRLHKQIFKHPLGEVRGLDRVFNRGPVAVGGDSNTVWQASYAPYHSYELNSFTASWRQVIDMSDFNNSVGTLPTGESGHAGSKHYGDRIGPWSRGEYHPLPWDRTEVEKHAAGRLELTAN